MENAGRTESPATWKQPLVLHGRSSLPFPTSTSQGSGADSFINLPRPLLRKEGRVWGAAWILPFTKGELEGVKDLRRTTLKVRFRFVQINGTLFVCLNHNNDY